MTEMERLVAVRGIEPWRRRLFLPAYRVKDAAKFAEVNPRTVNYWCFGGGQSGPALPHRERGAAISWMQMIEIAVVARMRTLGVSLQRIRRARDYIAVRQGCEFPFAEQSFMTDGARIFLDLAEQEGWRDRDAVVVADEAGQLDWKSMLMERLEQFDYERELALRWHVGGRDSPVLMDPQISFGAPTVRGVATWAIRGRWQAGESEIDIADDFELDQKEVRAALTFEKVKLNELRVH